MTVVKEIEIRKGMRNNSPAESTSPEMDGAEARYPHLAIGASARPQWVGACGGRGAVLGVSPSITAPSADIGGCSK